MVATNAAQRLVLLQAGLIEHLTCYVFTGRRCAVLRAARLAAELAELGELTPAQRTRWLELAEALEGMRTEPLSSVQRPRSQHPAGSVGRRPQPWLVWERSEEAV